MDDAWGASSTMHAGITSDAWENGLMPHGYYHGTFLAI